jgi:hypothetical protein
LWADGEPIDPTPTTNQAAIIALFRAINHNVGNLPPMPGVAETEYCDRRYFKKIRFLVAGHLVTLAAVVRL